MSSISDGNKITGRVTGGLEINDLVLTVSTLEDEYGVGGDVDLSGTMDEDIIAQRYTNCRVTTDCDTGYRCSNGVCIEKQFQFTDAYWDVETAGIGELVTLTVECINCDDNDPLTGDVCVNPGTIDSFCQNNPIGECNSGDTRQCGVSDVGECRFGVETCGADRTWGSCVGNVDPTTEICDDGLDNDCDGLTDVDDIECEEVSPFCTDSDGGRNYAIKGSVIDSGTIYIDVCSFLAGKNILVEYFCLDDNGGVFRELYNCLAGEYCDDGACKLVTGCIDSCINLGYECGNQLICGEFISCGLCPIGEVCAGGQCVLKCGDGIIQEPEQCDDGNRVNGDGCSSSCVLEHIGGVCSYNMKVNDVVIVDGKSIKLGWIGRVGAVGVISITADGFVNLIYEGVTSVIGGLEITHVETNYVAKSHPDNRARVDVVGSVCG